MALELSSIILNSMIMNSYGMRVKGSHIMNIMIVSKVAP